MSQGQEIALIDVRQHQAMLAKKEDELSKWCTGGGGEVRGEMLIRYALAEMQTNNDLRNCTPTSIYLALLACGVTGLAPGKLRGYSFLVPFGKKIGDAYVQEATFMMGWRGVKHIGYRSALNMVSAVVHDKDDFDFDKGSAPFVRYKPALKAPGPVIGAAAWVVLPKGGLEIEYMTKDELDKVKEAATRLRKSPAWDGPFRDQMERKSALKRLGKQVEMGEDFFRANAIEQAEEDNGSAVAALDQLTDGAASKTIGEQSKEAAAFGALPRPAQVQVPAKAKADKPVDAKATERPTSSAGSSAGAASTSRPAPSPSASTTPASASSKSSTGGSAGSHPTPAPSGGTSSSSESRAGAGGSSKVEDKSSSTASGSASTETPNTASSDAPDDSGDVAGEPAEGEEFDTSFGSAEDAAGDAAEDPQTPQEFADTFATWSSRVTTKEQARADTLWRDLFRGWLAVCKTREEVDAAKDAVAAWAKKLFSLGTKANPKSRDPEIGEMMEMYAHRSKELP
jgi:recombination protein RecT